MPHLTLLGARAKKCNIKISRPTNKNFILLVYHSSSMPNDIKSVFTDMEKQFPFVRNVYVPDKNIVFPDDLIQPRMMTFRIDNDDGLPVNFIERLMQICNRSDDFFDNVVITIPKIRKVQKISDNEYKTNDSLFISNSIGLAYLSVSGKNMDLGNHRLIPYHRKFFCLDGTGGIQFIHESNVSNGFHHVYDKNSPICTLTKEQMKNLLRTDGYPDIDLSALK